MQEHLDPARPTTSTRGSGWNSLSSKWDNALLFGMLLGLVMIVIGIWMLLGWGGALIVMGVLLVVVSIIMGAT